MVATQETGPVQTSIDRVRAEMDRLVDMARQRGGQALDAVGIKSPTAAMFPMTDIIETNDAVHLVANLPGVSADLLDVNVTGQILRIRGSVAPSPHQMGGNLYRNERHVGAFERAFPLPCTVDAEATQAELVHGVLNVRLPKVADEIGYKVPVRAGEPGTTINPVTTPGCE